MARKGQEGAKRPGRRPANLERTLGVAGCGGRDKCALGQELRQNPNFSSMCLDLSHSSPQTNKDVEKSKGNKSRTATI